MKRFPASLNCEHRAVLSNVMDRTPVGGGHSIVLTAAEDLALRQLAGAMNDWAARPGGCDDITAMPYDVAPEVLYLDFSRKLYNVRHDRVTAFPFRVPLPPFPGPNGALLRMSTAEYDGERYLRQVSVSALPGDMNGLSNGVGTEAGAHFMAGVEFPSGALLYANVLAIDPVTPGRGLSGFSIIWPPNIWPLP